MGDTDREGYAADDARWSALMAGAQAGNEADYRQLLTELDSAVSRYLRSRLGAQEFLEDCVQEVLLALHQARHTYDPGRRFRPWLFAIVRHKAIDHLRRQRSQQRLLDDGGAPDAGYNHGERMENDLSGGRLINALPEQHREAITLTKIMGLSHREAADRLAISEGALKVRVHRAMGNLRRLLEADAP